MSPAPDIDEKHRVPSLVILGGFIVAALATTAWLLAIGYGTDLTNERAVAAHRIGAGLVFVVGLVLIIRRRTRLLGIGIALGTPIAFVAELIIWWFLIAGATR